MAKVIKAKYPKIGSEFTHSGIQGFGSTYGGNVNPVVKNQIERNETLITENSSEFPN
tara:strand:+ start:9829 stop:9999 length:171 start_codon:yes stop_codon:yes gene_type:complete